MFIGRLDFIKSFGKVKMLKTKHKWRKSENRRSVNDIQKIQMLSILVTIDRFRDLTLGLRQLVNSK